MNSHFDRLAILPSAVLIGLTPGAAVLAQDQPAVEEITVTGTRILRRDFTSQSPIVTVEAETFEARSNIGLEAALNQLPQFTVAGTQAESSAAGTPFPQASAAPGAATLNLRGMGLNRSLVLMDGRRVQPVNGLLVVDLNTIPSAAIERVEVITGGAAAVYGADAIAGVVNFIMKRDFEGLEVDARYGMTQEGDGEETSVSGLMGADFADGRGNVMIGANFSERKIILGKDRDWVVEGWEDPGTMAGGIGSSNLSQFIVDGFNAPAAGFPLQPGSNYAIDQNGRVFDPADPLNDAHPYTGPIGGGSGFKINPDGTLGYNDREHSYLQLPLERYSIFGSGEIELTDRVNVFSEIRFSETFATSSGFTSGVFNVWSPTIPFNSQYDDPSSPDFGNPPPDEDIALHPVSPELGALLASRPDPDAPWTYSGGLDYLGNFRTETTSNVYQVIGGVDGEVDFGSRVWNWEVYASHGKTSVNAHQPEGFPYLPRLQNLFNADQYGEGFDISTLPGFAPVAVTGHCTSGLPIFDPDGSVDNTASVSQDCSDYVVLRMNSITTLVQDVIEANVTGDLARMPAGDLQFALGTAYRKEDFAFDPDSGYNANQDYPNVVQNVILPVSVDGETDVTEVYGELAIPLLSDKPFVQSLELNPGVRFSDYNTVGSVETYKILGGWTINDWVTFRAGRQLANRAPNVTELFTPVGGSQITGGTDACAYYPNNTQTWGNRPENPNRLNLQTLCQHLMVREGAPPSLYEPGAESADTYAYNVFGGTNYFPFAIGVTEGNPGLDSEEADTYTFGVVLNSPFEQPVFEQLTLAIDWYRIELEQAIGTPGHDTIYRQCMDARFNPLIAAEPGTYSGEELAAGNPFCALIQREYVGGTPLTPGNYGADRKFSAQYINQGGIKSEGIDVQLNWGIDFASTALSGIPGQLNVSVQASFLDTYAEAAFPGADFVDFTGTTVNSSFDYSTFTTLRYANGPWSLGLRWQHLPSLDTAPDAGENTLGVDSHDQFDLFGNFTLGERYDLRFGIDNLLNEDPAIVGATTTDNNLGSTNSNYDQFGRRFFLGLTVSM